MRTGSTFVRHTGPIRTASAAIVAVVIPVAVPVVRVLIQVAVAILLAGVSRLIVASRTRLRVVTIRPTRWTRIARRIRRAFMRNAGPIRTASPAAIIIVIVPVMGILILAILITAIVRVLLPMIVVITARMREVASSIGDRIAASVVVSIATMVSIVAMSVAVIGNVVIAMLWIRGAAIGAMIVVVPWMTVVAAARLKWLVPRRWRHLHYHRTLIDALRNSGALAGVNAENALVRRSTCGAGGDPAIMMIAPIVVVTDEYRVVHRARIHDDLVIHHRRTK